MCYRSQRKSSQQNSDAPATEYQPLWANLAVCLGKSLSQRCKAAMVSEEL